MHMSPAPEQFRQRQSARKGAQMTRFSPIFTARILRNSLSVCNDLPTGQARIRTVLILLAQLTERRHCINAIGGMVASQTLNQDN